MRPSCCYHKTLNHLLRVSVYEFKLPGKVASLAEGYTNFNRTLPAIAAISNGGATATAGCAGEFVCHDNEWAGPLGTLVDFASAR